MTLPPECNTEQLVHEIWHAQSMTPDIKLSLLALIEPIIEQEYSLNNTQIKPVYKMSLQDVWPL